MRREKVLLKVNAASTADSIGCPTCSPSYTSSCRAARFKLADISSNGRGENPLNANAPWPGKTVECIGAIFEGWA